MLLCDTGVLLAAGNVKDRTHHACVELLRHAEGPLLGPSPVLGEVGYLLQSRVAPQAEVTFLRSLGGDGFHIAELEDQDIRRMAELVETYLDLPLGIVDATMIAIPERLELTEVATLDQRHFGVVRPSHTRTFTLLPGAGPEPGVSRSAVWVARYPRARGPSWPHLKVLSGAVLPGPPGLIYPVMAAAI